MMNEPLSPNPEDTPKNSDDKKTALLYAAAVIALIFQFMPQPALLLTSIILLFVFGIAVKVYSSNSRDGTLIHNHAIYLSKTIKIWSFFLFVSLVGAGLYVRTEYDFMQLVEIAGSFAEGKIETDEARRFAYIGVAAMAPSTIYLLYRIGKGLFFALRAEKLAKPRSFF